MLWDCKRCGRREAIIILKDFVVGRKTFKCRHCMLKWEENCKRGYEVGLRKKNDKRSQRAD